MKKITDCSILFCTRSLIAALACCPRVACRLLASSAAAFCLATSVTLFLSASAFFLFAASAAAFCLATSAALFFSVSFRFFSFRRVRRLFFFNSVSVFFFLESAIFFCSASFFLWASSLFFSAQPCVWLPLFFSQLLLFVFFLCNLITGRLIYWRKVGRSIFCKFTLITFSNTGS